MNRSRIIFSLLVGGLLASSAFAVRPRTWVADTTEEFLDGHFTGMSVTMDGRLVPGPALRQLWDAETPYVLCAVPDGQGGAYVGTGHDGKVFRLDSQGKASIVFDAEEPDVFALAVGPGNVLYVAAGSGGKVYRVEAGGKATALDGPKDKYVWSLAVDARGVLYAGTGTDGKIYRFRDGKAELFYDSEETHVMALLAEPDGRLLAGTAPGGLVLAIGPDGKGRTLFDAPHAEIHQLLRDRYGNVLALGIGAEMENEASAAEAAVDPFAQAFAQTPRKRKKAGADDYSAFGYGTATRPSLGGLYQIAADGSARTLWSSPDFKAYSAALDEGGDIFVGTSDRGRILLIRDGRPQCIYAESGQEQVTGLLSDPAGMYVFTSNAGRGFRLLAQPPEACEYTTDVIDTDCLSRLGSVKGLLPANAPRGRFSVFARTGGSSRIDGTWSPWSAPVDLSVPAAVEVPPGRFFQLRLVLQPAGQLPAAAAETWVEGFGIVYLQQNQAPRLTSFSVNPPGVHFQESPSMPNNTGIPEYGDRSSFSFPDALQNGVTRQTAAASAVKVFRAGTLSMGWTASDPNDDLLEYAVAVRRSDAARWETLRTHVRDTSLNLGIDTLGEGRYVFRVTVSDDLSNPKGPRSEDSMVSRVVTVDFTAPVIRLPGPDAPGEAVVEDALTPLYLAELSCDGGVSWTVLPPADGICDSRREHFPLPTGEKGSEGRWRIVRVMDAAGNVAVATLDR